MKKILILCYDFPPLNSAGSIRPYAWYRHARQCGFEPVVVCRSWPFPVNHPADRFKTTPSGETIHVEKTEYGTIYYVNHKNSLKEKLILKYGFENKQVQRRLLSLLELLGRFTFSFLDDKYEMYRGAQHALETENPDVIIASGEPHILFRYCYKLLHRYGVPYVLDYRDGWHTNHTRNREGFLNKWIGRIELAAEKRALKDSLFFTSVIPQLVDGIQNNVTPHKGYIIPNGVELSTFNGLSRQVSNDLFTLVYTGTIYDAGYDIILEEGIKKFLSHYNPTNFEIHFYGIDLNSNKAVDTIKRIAVQYPAYIKILPRKPYRDILQLQLNATVLLSLIPGSQEKGIIAMKTYEYLASRRPVLVIPSEPSRKTPIFPDKGYQVFALTPDEVAEQIGKFYTRFKNGEDLSTGMTDEEIYSISREKSTKELFEKIDSELTTYINS